MTTTTTTPCRPAAVAVNLLVLVLTALLPSCCWGQNLFESTLNQQFDPDRDDNTPFCSIPPWQNTSETIWSPQEGMCGNEMEDILQNETILQNLAEAYAPYLYFHPQERFTMSSVQRTFGDPTTGRIYYQLNGRELFDSELRQQSLLETTRNVSYVMHSHRFYFEHDLSINYRGGDGFSNNGISKAPIYYRAFDSGNGTMTFNYFTYYTWNGPGSLGIITSRDRLPQYVRFRLPPFGMHEGDWESMSVTVCKHATPSQPLAMTFRQHSYGQVLDCGKGECTFHRDSPTNPVGFVSLNAHTIYPFSASEMVFDEVFPLEFFFNLQGVLIVDRVTYKDRRGNYRYFQPNNSTTTTTNVIRIPEQQDIPENTTEEFYWAAFGGYWGSTQDSGFEHEVEQPQCIESYNGGGNNNSNGNGNESDPNFGDDEAQACPTHDENEPFWWVMQMLDVEDAVDSIIKAARRVKTAFFRFFENTFRGPTGPATRSYYGQLRHPGNAPLWNLPTINTSYTAEMYCDKLINPPDPDRFPTTITILPLIQNIIGVMLMCVFFTIFNIVYFLRKRNEDVRPVLLTDTNGRFLQPDIRTRRWVFLHARIYTVAYVITFVGAMLFFVGYSALTDLLEDTFHGIDFRAIEILFLSLGLFILIIDTMLLVILWLRTEDLWRRINVTYFDIVGDTEERKRFDVFEQRKLYKAELVDVFFLVTFALLLVSLILAVVMVIVAIFNVGFAYAFGQICDTAIGSLDGVCFRFDALGLEEIRCGGDFAHFCNEWATSDMSATLWGAFIVICGHFYLIASGGMAALSNRSVTRALLLYPTNEEYVRLLDKIDSLGMSLTKSREDIVIDDSEMVQPSVEGENLAHDDAVAAAPKGFIKRVFHSKEKKEESSLMMESSG